MARTRPADSAAAAHESTVVGVRHNERSPNSDKLNYLADLANELRKIADEEGCRTLSGLLAVAELEARQKAGNP